jgi:phosphate transport system substrate-binding protein
MLSTHIITLPSKACFWFAIDRFAFILVAILFAAPIQAETLKIGGSGGAIETMRLLGTEFRKNRPDTNIVIVPSLGSGGGIKAVLAGAIDVAVSSRSLKAAEQDAVAVEYGRTPLVFVVSSRTKASTITLRELVAIYKGDTKTWPDGNALRLVLRPESESDIDILKGISPEMNDAVKAALVREGMLIAMTDQDNADHLEKIPGAVGTTTLAQILAERRGLKPLTLEGAAPSPRALANKTYPYYKVLYIVTSPKSGPLARKFSEFVRSPAGQAMLARNGYWVAPAKAGN